MKSNLRIAEETLQEIFGGDFVCITYTNGEWGFITTNSDGNEFWRKSQFPSESRIWAVLKQLEF